MKVLSRRLQNPDRPLLQSGGTVSMSLKGKTALVTGAATGIGAAIAKGLAEAGTLVFGADIAWKPRWWPRRKRSA